MRYPVTLPNDYGLDLCINGEVVAEDMHFNQKNGMLTVEKIYATEDGKLAYGVISAIGDHRERRAYLIEPHGEEVDVFNGAMTMHLPMDMLMQFLSMTLAEDAKSAAKGECGHILQKLAVND